MKSKLSTETVKKCGMREFLIEERASLVRKRSRVRFPSWAPDKSQSNRSYTEIPLTDLCNPFHAESRLKQRLSLSNLWKKCERPRLGSKCRASKNGRVLSPYSDGFNQFKSQCFVNASVVQWQHHGLQNRGQRFDSSLGCQLVGRLSQCPLSCLQPLLRPGRFSEREPDSLHGDGLLCVVGTRLNKCKTWAVGAGGFWDEMVQAP